MTKRVLSTATSALMLAGITVVLASGNTGSPPHLAAAAASEPTLQTIDLATGAGAARGFSRAANDGPRTTARFSLIGATWADASATPAAAVQVRTRSMATGAWTPWQTLEADGPSPAAPGSKDAIQARGSTDPLWVDPSDGVQARIAGGTAPPPRGMRLDLIDPGTPAATMKPAAVTVPERPIPKVVTRAGWGANEKLVKNAPEYTTDVSVLFVHHTAGTNNYSCSDSAAIIRSIQAYHVKSKHWNDIGYNFLVDKCGTLFEGRRGGITKPVLGAHTLGFNSRSSAIAVLGNYGSQAVSRQVKTVIAQVASYKLGIYGHAPGGRAALVSSGSDRYAKGSTAILNRVSGHRDTGKTECPGNTLYSQLGSIRSIAAAGPADLTITKINGARKTGSTWFTRSAIRPYWQVDTATTLMDRYDVYVDGELAASVPATQGQQLLQLTPGRHNVRVRAVALNNRVSYASLAVYADATLPQFTSGPSVALRTGSLNGIVPVRLRWAVQDAGGLSSVVLTTPASADLGVTATSWAGSVSPSTETTYGLRATDRAGNARSVAAVRTPVLVPEDRAEQTGTWRSVGNSAYLDGSALRATTAGASLSWTFTGRSAALAFSRTAVSGAIQVYVDDQPAGTIDLRSTDTLYRRAVWSRSWNASDQHTVKIVVEGTTGRPGVISDGLVYLK